MEAIDFGVCRLAVVPVRKDPDHRGEQVTQLLFGDHYEVLSASKDKKWLWIKIFTDQFEGWLEEKQHHRITHEYFEQINLANYKITTDLTSRILYKKNPLTVVMGSVVPISNSELFKIEEQFAFSGESKSLGQRRDFEYLRTIAIKYVHSPYQWGGRSPFGIDCAGLVQMVFKICGYMLPRRADRQAQYGKPVDFADTQPGDMACFVNSKGEVDHVGIVLDNERIIHAFGSVRIDSFLEDGILNPETRVFTHQLGSVRRILETKS